LTIFVITLIIPSAGILDTEAAHTVTTKISEMDAFYELQKTADLLLRGVEETLRPLGLSHTQYNVLRILRAAGSEGLTCGQIAEQMMTRDPDVTRLLDRLGVRKLVIRWRDHEDRRVVKTRVTGEGLQIIRRLDAPISGLHRRQLNHLGGPNLRQLSDLLVAARGDAE